MDLKEEIIWKKIQQKDILTFERYYKAYFKVFFLLAYKYVKDQAQAQEIVNDIFLKIWEDADRINITTSFKSYIYKAIINRCINALNKSKNEMSLQAAFNMTIDESYELRQIEENELKTKLYATIGRLPDQCKKVFEMSRFEELKQQEIADKLGISIKTVKNHITIALKQLSKAIDKSWILFILILRNFLSVN
jgi:RNA polymerase sigma-70 factor (ECF subfamily)